MTVSCESLAARSSQTSGAYNFGVTFMPTLSELEQLAVACGFVLERHPHAAMAFRLVSVEDSSVVRLKGTDKLSKDDIEYYLNSLSLRD